MNTRRLMSGSTATTVIPAARRPGISLLECTIAFTILGVGLIMVAAVFPVALSQHQASTDQARVIEMVSKADAMIRAKVDPSSLWVHPDYLPPGGALVGLDSPWYLLQSVNLSRGQDCWDAMPQGVGPTQEFYANLIDGDNPVDAFPGNATVFLGLDVISDKLAPFTAMRGGSACSTTGFGWLLPSASPFTDEEFMEAPNRLAWYGFYRRRASGATEYAVAVCKQRRGQLFAEQDVTRPSATSDLAGFQTDRRLPVPWRVLVAWPIGNVLTNAPDGVLLQGTIGLSVLAPVGTKIMVRGGVDSNAAPVPTVAAGTVLTVTDVIDDHTLEFTGDVSGLPLYNFAPGQFVAFDVWLFPPAVGGAAVDVHSPLLDWKVPL